MQFERSFVQELFSRLKAPRPRLQVLLGPRQVGKTTGIEQGLARWEGSYHFASADALPDPTGRWIEEQWELARRKSRPGEAGLLVLDEIQKVQGWSEAIKRLWDASGRGIGTPAVCLLGSSALLVARGLGESLAGRFEALRIGHWQYAEMHTAFGWDLEKFIFFGGYPGAAEYAGDEARWGTYVNGSLVEAALNRDVLALNPVEKPALLRRLFGLACDHAAEVLSYHKMLGQLTEAGNASTLARYQELLGAAGLLVGLPKHSGSAVRRRASSPKWLPLNSALITASRGLSFQEWRSRPEAWGRLVEAAAGAHLWAETQGRWGAALSWWREGNDEVDFVLTRGRRVLGIEVKSGRAGLRSPRSLGAFREAFPQARTLVVGAGGMGLEEFFRSSAGDLLGV